MEIKDKKRFLIDFLFIAVWIIIIFFISKFMLDYLLPFIIGGIIAFIVQKPAKFIHSKTRLNRGITAAVLSLLFYLIILGLFLFIGIRIIIYSKILLENFSVYYSGIKNFIYHIKERLTTQFNLISPELSDTVNDLFNKALITFGDKIYSLLTNNATILAKNIPSYFIGIAVTAVASCYISKDYYILGRFLKYMIGKVNYKKILKVKTILVESVFKFAKGYFILLVITYTELTIGFFILNVKYPFFIAFIVAFIDILPVLGCGTVLVPWAVIDLINGNAELGLKLIILYAIITVLRNFLEPKVIGGQIGINPLLTLLTMFLGLRLFGLFGIIICPVTLIVVIKYYKNEMDQDDQNKIRI